jgi:hypothetical protein
MSADQTKIEYLEQEIAGLQVKIANVQGAIIYVESVILHLKNQGAKAYNNRTPCVFEAAETKERRQYEGHSPEIFDKSAEEFLIEFEKTLKSRKIELARFEAKLANFETKLTRLK